jgi:hypothetical protein
MLFVPSSGNGYGLVTPSWGTTRPATTNGTSITPSIGSYNTYATVQSAISSDAYGLWININSNFSSTTSRNTIVTIGIDPAGGTSFVDTIPDLIGGGAASYAGGHGGVWYFFPIFITAGSTIGAKANGTVSSIIRVGTMVGQKPSGLCKVGSFVHSIGVSGNQGTTLTMGTTSEGAWSSLGTTTRDLWWWQLGAQIGSSDTAWNAVALHLDLAAGDATNKDLIIHDLLMGTTTTESSDGITPIPGVERYVRAGTEIFARCQTSGNADPIFVTAYGLGG